MSDDTKSVLMFIAMTTTVLFLIGGGMYGCPHYNVYSSRLDGEAKLAHAQYEREVQVRDAQGKLEASSLLAQAEVERAKGVAEANKVIGNSLKNNEMYLRYLWIHNLEVGNNSVIYIPTEANLPILEANRFRK